MAWQCSLPVVTVKAFKKRCISSGEDEADDDRMAVKRVGMLGVGVRKMKALTVKMETDKRR